jgi:hypothetical protein
MPPPERHRFYIYNASIGRELGGFKVINEERHGVQSGERYVMLTLAQAEYWMANGTIGPQPLSHVTNEHRDQLHQLSGGRIPKHEGDVVLTHQVRSMGIPGKTGKLFKVSTIRNAVQTEHAKADGLKVGLDPKTGKPAETQIDTQTRMKHRQAQMSASKTRRVHKMHEGMSRDELRRMGK